MAVRVSGYICFVSSGSCYSCRKDTSATFSHQFHVFRAIVLFPCKDFCNAAQAVSQVLRSTGAAPLEAVDCQLQNLVSKAI